MIDAMRRAEPLTAEERDFADWAASEGFCVLFTKTYPSEDDEQQFEPYFVQHLIVEEMIGDRLHAFEMVPVGVTSWPEARSHLAALLRAGFDRYKEEAGVA